MFPEKLICFVAYFWTLFQSSPQRLLYNFTTGALATLFCQCPTAGNQSWPSACRSCSLSLSLSAGGHQEELEVVAPCNGPIVGVMSVAQLFAEAAKKKKPCQSRCFYMGNTNNSHAQPFNRQGRDGHSWLHSTHPSSCSRHWPRP